MSPSIPIPTITLPLLRVHLRRREGRQAWSGEVQQVRASLSHLNSHADRLGSRAHLLLTQLGL